MLKILIEDGAGQKVTIPLTGEELTVGRSEESGICLTDRNVSRFHARFVSAGGQSAIEPAIQTRCAPQRRCTLVLINDRPIASSTLLVPGDVIRIGDYRLEVQFDEAAGNEAPFPSPTPPSAPTLVGRLAKTMPPPTPHPLLVQATSIVALTPPPPTLRGKFTDGGSAMSEGDQGSRAVDETDAPPKRRRAAVLVILLVLGAACLAALWYQVAEKVSSRTDTSSQTDSPSVSFGVIPDAAAFATDAGGAEESSILPDDLREIAWIRRADLQLKANDFTKAAAALEACVRDIPKSSECYRRLGVAYGTAATKTKNARLRIKATKAFKSYLNLAPGNDPHRESIERAIARGSRPTE